MKKLNIRVYNKILPKCFFNVQILLIFFIFIKASLIKIIKYEKNKNIQRLAQFLSRSLSLRILFFRCDCFWPVCQNKNETVTNFESIKTQKDSNTNLMLLENNLFKVMPFLWSLNVKGDLRVIFCCITSIKHTQSTQTRCEVVRGQIAKKIYPREERIIL